MEKQASTTIRVSAFRSSLRRLTVSTMISEAMIAVRKLESSPAKAMITTTRIAGPTRSRSLVIPHSRGFWMKWNNRLARRTAMVIFTGPWRASSTRVPLHRRRHGDRGNPGHEKEQLEVVSHFLHEERKQRYGKGDREQTDYHGEGRYTASGMAAQPPALTKWA